MGTPELDISDMDKHVPLVKESWKAAMARKTFSEIGCMIYDAISNGVPELQPLLGSSGRLMIAIKFMDMFTAMVSLADDPYELQVRLTELGPMHRSKGVRAHHLVPMREVLVGALKSVLGGEWREEMGPAWDWLWEIVSVSMMHGVDTAGASTVLVAQSWETALEKHTVEDLGIMIYDALFEIAPNFEELFRTPKQVMAVKFVEMVSTIISHGEDAEGMDEQLRWLGLRHVLYGVSHAHVPVMGQVLISVLKTALFEEWTEDCERAWVELWNLTSSKMMDTIEEGEKHGSAIIQTWDRCMELCAKGHNSAATTFGHHMHSHLAVHAPDLVHIFAFNLTCCDAVPASADATKDSLIGLGTVLPDRGQGHDGKQAKKEKSGASMRSAPRDGSPHGHPLRKQDSHIRHLGRRDSADFTTITAMGAEIVRLMSILTDLLWDPQRQQEKVTSLGIKYHQCGMRLHHLHQVGLSIKESIRDVLGTQWDDSLGEHFAWLWGMAKLSIAKVLEACERDYASLVQEQWSKIKGDNSFRELGSKFYHALTTHASELLHLFKRPKNFQAHSFVQLMEMLVESARDPEVFFEQIKQISVRHIKYGVKTDMLKPFGKALFFLLQEGLGDKWDHRAISAWVHCWRNASLAMGRNLSIGSNLITLALVRGDADHFKTAISCAPRKSRSDWLCRVDVNGEVESPIVWALMDGKLSIARFIICDLLTIRADSEQYYYGRGKLWRTHPDIVTQLCRSNVELLDSFLDGHIWHSQYVHKGKVRVNYYIKDLYGDPDKVLNPWDSPMANLVQLCPPSQFRHPVIEQVLQIKWQTMGQPYFLLTEAIYGLLLSLFLAGSIVYQDECGGAEILRLFNGVVALVMGAAQASLMVWQRYTKQMVKVQVLVFRVWVPRWLGSNVYNVGRFIACVLMVVDCFYDSCILGGRAEHEKVEHEVDPDAVGSPDVHQSLTAFIAVLLWMQLLQALIFDTRLAAFTYTIGLMFKDVTHNLVVILIFLLGFASALAALKEENFETIESSFIVLLKDVLEIEGPSYERSSSLGFFFIITCVALVAVFMLSILIAQMSLTYERLGEDKIGFAMKHRASLCIEIESFMPLLWRQKLYTGLDFSKPVEFDHGDEGPAGGIQRLHTSEIRNDKKYVPDRILRFTGESSPSDPWPMIEGEGFEEAREV
eukprot:CAMPEP_0206218674 /NCGR_PEP_ID=MMETSP0047_2-20121206/3921_1 /ASSEMBLY_ACC=CAM_ASM_000192 /TAXON_ID=195065 /ORGANISM="Chroomonas mesostigmatica_cf, Strain CCMP1168" /LENGTH=1169 /DNA_ID=CAMNT_0053641185 /DNA_START=104 /DNA_END=3613 /DNA_ORIENTATION=+